MADKKISEMIDGGTIQVTDRIPVERNDDNYQVEVKLAATLDVGTSPGDLVQVQDIGGNPGLPSLDGSNLYNISIPSGGVDSVNGVFPDSSGDVEINADHIDDTSTSHKFVTSTDLTKLSNLSGTNTGDQTTSGTANRITVTSGSTNPVVDIASTYAGQATITTIGTLTAGVWNANPIGDSYISSASAWNAKLDDISDLVVAGTGLSRSGSGTSVDPYVFDADGPGSISLSSLSDVNISSPTTGDTLVFDGVNWVNDIVPILNSVVDDFVGDGSEDTFQLSVTPPDAEHVFAFISGVAQHEFTITGDEITFDSPPANGLSIQVRVIYGAATGGGGGGSGTVTSVNLTAPVSGVTVSGGPITTSGSIILTLSDDLAAVEGLTGTGIAVRTATSTWATRSIAGTTDRINITNGSGVSGNPTIDIASNYSGQSSIVTLGTVTTGVWNGSSIGDSYISSASAWNAKLSNITGLISAGSNISLSGTGAGGDPYIINASVTGGVSGPVSSVDNTISRWNGTSGDSIQGSNIAVSDSDEISGFKTLFNNQTGTTYTLVSGDTGKTVTLNNSSAITCTLPNNLSIGFTCEIIQKGTGQVTFSAASGATLTNRSSHTKIAGRYGAVRLSITDNSGGTSAIYNLAGDTSS